MRKSPLRKQLDKIWLQDTHANKEQQQCSCNARQRWPAALTCSRRINSPRSPLTLARLLYAPLQLQQLPPHEQPSLPIDIGQAGSTGRPMQ